MGDIGPCGPCTEIHIDLRENIDRKKIDAKTLVNQDDPLVIEIWNLVFVQFNRKSDNSLEPLPNKHVDTGMGFERLCMALQNKKSNYDTDIFAGLITKVGEISKLKYIEGKFTGKQEQINIATRVIVDHIRTISFSIADGQLPSNTGAGYVIRRILRRAIRYGYQTLNLKEPFMYLLVDTLIEKMGSTFNELEAQKELIKKVIKEEESSFYKTLASGIKRIEQYYKENNNIKEIPGDIVFELYDTYGFPIDLTALIAEEYNLTIDEVNFKKHLQKQKDRSRNAAIVDTDDWIVLKENNESNFVGYNNYTYDVNITKYRKVKGKKDEVYHLVFDNTPFYAESGGQVGSAGYIEHGKEKTLVINTIKENKLSIHIVEKLPENLELTFNAVLDSAIKDTEKNHTATHLLHNVLRTVLGNHVEQKGSLVNSEYLRFDFSHFQKLTAEELITVEKLVNEKIRENIKLEESIDTPIEKAKEMGAIALFGEKYDDKVRVIKFNDSTELCGGTHVSFTGEIGHFIIISEGAIASGIRRIEAITGKAADEYFIKQREILNEIKSTLKAPQNILKSITNLLNENSKQNKKIEEFAKKEVLQLKQNISNTKKEINGINVIAEIINLESVADVKNLSFQLKSEIDNLFLILGISTNGKANISVLISDNLVKEKDLHAGKIIKEIAKEIQGGGGGQASFATAGGKKPEGLQDAINKAITIIKDV